MNSVTPTISNFLDPCGSYWGNSQVASEISCKLLECRVLKKNAKISAILWPKNDIFTLPETNIAPENGWLEY